MINPIDVTIIIKYVMDLHQLVTRNVAFRTFCQSFVTAFVFQYIMWVIFAIRLSVAFTSFVQENEIDISIPCLELPSWNLSFMICSDG